MAIKAKESILDNLDEVFGKVNKLYLEISGILKEESHDVVELVLGTLFGDLLHHRSVQEAMGSLEKAKAFEEEYSKKVKADKEALHNDVSRINTIIQNEVMFAMASLHLEDNIRIIVKEILAEKTNQTDEERHQNLLHHRWKL